MGAMKPPSARYVLMDRLLFRYGMGQINTTQFDAEMKQHKFTQADIDKFLVEHRKREAEKERR
jgi:hypothetical protein